MGVAGGCAQATRYGCAEHTRGRGAGTVRRCGLAAAHGYTRVELQAGGDGGEEWLVGGVADVVCALDGKGTGGKSAEVGGLAGTCWTRW